MSSFYIFRMVRHIADRLFFQPTKVSNFFHYHYKFPKKIFLLYSKNCENIAVATFSLHCSQMLSSCVSFSKHSRRIVEILLKLSRSIRFAITVYRTLAACTQRPSGLAQAGGTIQFMRDTNVHIPTALSAAINPRLRQTASCVLAFVFVCRSIQQSKKLALAQVIISVPLVVNFRDLLNCCYR